MIKDLASDLSGTTMGDLERSGGERSEAPRSGGFPIVCWSPGRDGEAPLQAMPPRSTN